MLKSLNFYDLRGSFHTERMWDHFNHGNHFCIILEYLNNFKATKLDKLAEIREIARHLLKCISLVHCLGIIHADLKPDNIMKTSQEWKIVDFGNSCFLENINSYYEDFQIQSLRYRAPEVLSGIPFGLEIDMWSMGCILSEFYLGRQLFCKSNPKEMLLEISCICGPFPSMYQKGIFFDSSFETVEYEMLYHRISTLKQIFDTRDYYFVDFIARMLFLDPQQRLKAEEALHHPFLRASTEISIFPTQLMFTREYHSEKSSPKKRNRGPKKLDQKRDRSPVSVTDRSVLEIVRQIEEDYVDM